MSRRVRNQTKVSLFPFLAVLLCAMGALLVLLVITTRQIRDEAIRQAAVKSAVEPELPPPAAEPEPAYQWPEWDIVLGAAEELERELLPTPPPPSLLAPKPVFVKRETDAPPPDLTAELQQLRRQLQRANAQLADRRQAAAEIEKRRAALLAEIEKRENVLQNAEQVIARFQTQRSQLSREAAALERKTAAMTRELQQLQQQTAALAKRPRSTPNVLKVVPYDGQQGTTRRPILIECTGNTIRFVPEGIELTERDLVGFSLANNPLLAGVLAAEQYWMKRDRVEGHINRPYVLLIVRPDGIPAYYAARRLLNDYQQASGYELLTADQTLALPEVDSQAQQQIAQAVQKLLRQRGGAPAVARTPFPQTDPELLDRLRRGEDSLSEGLESGSDRPGSSGATTGNPDGKRFKFVQTSQGLKMVPIEEPTLKRFESSGRSGDRAVSENLSPRAENSGANRATSEPPPLPSLPEGSRIKTLTPAPSGDSQRSGLDPGTRVPPSPSADPRAEQPYDPSNVPDAWTPLLEARRRNRTGGSSATGGQRGDAASSPASRPSAAAEGISSPLGETGGLAFKRTIEIKISGTQMRVANRNPLAIPAGVSTERLMSAIVLELRREVQSWKDPPEQFHWKPTVRFVVYPGGNRYVERLRPAFEEQGLLSGVEYEISAQESDWRPVTP